MTQIKPDFTYKVDAIASKTALFTKVCYAMLEQNLISDVIPVVAALLKREELSDTRITEQCAMAHCQVDAVLASQIIVVDCQASPLNWTESVSPVTQVVFLLLRPDETPARLKEIQSFVRSLALVDVLEDLPPATLL